MKTFWLRRCLVATIIFMAGCVIVSLANAETRIGLFNVTNSALKNISDARSYVNRIIRVDKISNYKVSKKKNYYYFDSKNEIIKVYPNSGMILFTLKGEKYKIDTDHQVSLSQDEVKSIAQEFLENNIKLHLSNNDEVYIHDIQQVKGKTIDLVNRQEYLTIGNMIVIFRRKIDGHIVVGDGNFVKIFVNLNRQVVSYEYQWDEISFNRSVSTLRKEEIESQYNFIAEDLVYICSDRYSATRELIPAYIGHSTSTSEIETRDAISGNLIKFIRSE